MNAGMLQRAKAFYRKTGEIEGAARMIGLTVAELDWLLWTGAPPQREGKHWTWDEDRMLRATFTRFRPSVLACGLGRSERAVTARAAVIGAYRLEAA